MTQDEFPQRLRPWWHPASLLGSIFVGGYPRDKKIRTTALLLTGIVALWSVVKDGIVNDRRALDAERKAHAENVAVAITTMSVVAESVDRLAVTMAQEHASAETFRQAWFSTMGERRIAPKPVRVNQVDPTR